MNDDQKLFAELGAEVRKLRAALDAVETENRIIKASQEETLTEIERLRAIVSDTPTPASAHAWQSSAHLARAYKAEIEISRQRRAEVKAAPPWGFTDARGFVAAAKSYKEINKLVAEHYSATADATVLREAAKDLLSCICVWQMPVAGSPVDLACGRLNKILIDLAK